LGTALQHARPVQFGHYGEVVSDDELAQLLGEQVAYYRARASEYDRTSPSHESDGYSELVTALRRFTPRGRVLELACGTGQWTVELAKYAATLTAVDAAPEMLALNRARVARADVEYVTADLFAWSASERYDVVFFAAWLSHVPPQRFAQFWEMVGICLADHGRVFVIDELPAVAGHERPLSDAVAPAVERTLSTGARFRTVKVFYEPQRLAEQLVALGWNADARLVSWRFYYATATRAVAS
jgi:SAM-dependent methyltransferase